MNDPTWNGDPDPNASQALEDDPDIVPHEVEVDVAARLDDGLGQDDDPGWVLFDGDEGKLDLRQRCAYLALLKHRFITAQSKPQEWRAIVANPGLFTSRLNDLFLELHLDREREVAFKRQVSPEGERGKFPTLLYDTPYTREQTIVLVYLRSRHLTEQMSGTPGRVLVDEQDIVEYARQFHPSNANDPMELDRKIRKAIEFVTGTGLLIATTDQQRFEIPSAIEVVLSIDTLTRLLQWLKKSNDTEDPADATSGQPLDLPPSVEDENA